ncbi:MAG: RrF2 family transcriptional regulator [Patescibacteria group bacterium]
MRIPKQEDFAMLLMGELARYYHVRLVTLREIAQTHGVSLLFLKKIVRFLRQAGLVKSKEGATGGYFLAQKPRAITLWQIIQAAAGQNKIPRALLRRKTCPLYSECLPQKIKKTVSRAISQSFSAITLADLVN